MTDLLINIGIALVVLAAVLLAFVALVWFGFRMGRQVAEKPIAPMVAPKKEAPMFEEDPYYEAMHGTKQPRIPTVEG